ncbi:MAG: GIY-YIG nuclease family protein [Chitinophagaceae bacterium]
MKISSGQYYIYITTDYKKSVLYTGVTNNLQQRIIEHYLSRGNPKSFTGRYHSYYLLYYECFSDIRIAIAREKEIKGWIRAKKEALIDTLNPERKFLNDEIFDVWPPDKMYHRGKAN